MNERIKELVIQSGFKKYDKDDGIYSPYIEGEELNDELQEFAVKIINDCVDACLLAGDTRWMIPPTQDQIVLDCVREIRLRFGLAT